MNQWSILVMAISLVMILEGLVPCLAPNVYQKYLKRAAKSSPQQFRIMGAALLIVGSLLMGVVHA